MSKEVLRNTIQEMWEIIETEGQLRQEGFPFVLVCTNAFGDQNGWPCHTIEEAEQKLNAIAQEYDRKGHVLGIA